MRKKSKEYDISEETGANKCVSDGWLVGLGSVPVLNCHFTAIQLRIPHPPKLPGGIH